MNWIPLTKEEEIDSIVTDSFRRPILLFKHSTRCSISSAAIDRLERNWKENEMKDTKAYYLDLLKFRPVSALIESRFAIEHESPQVLLIKNGKCDYHASHTEINYTEIKSAVN